MKYYQILDPDSLDSLGVIQIHEGFSPKDKPLSEVVQKITTDIFDKATDECELWESITDDIVSELKKQNYIAERIFFENITQY